LDCEPKPFEDLIGDLYEKRYVRYNFKTALITDEKRELLTSIVLDTHTGAAVDHLQASAAYLLSESPTFAPLPDPPAPWAAGAPPLSLPAPRPLLDRATRAAAGALAPTLSPLRARAARLLELDRARLVAYYAGLERDLERRFKRTEDQTRRANLQDKLAATRADHAAKLADAEARYHLRIELELVNIAVISQPKNALSMQIENRQAQVTRDLLWDPLRHRIEPLLCDVCTRPRARLYLCANNHLACDDCLAPQCVDCKRVYCRSCAAELTTCAVCGRPVCQKSLTRCRECGKGTCREHATLCHAPAPAPAPAPPPPEQAPAPAPAPPPAHAPAKAPRKPKKPPARPAKRPVEDPGYRLHVQVEPGEPVVIGFVVNKAGKEIAQRVWQLTGEGIAVSCFCEKGWACPMAHTLLQPEPASGIEAQLEVEIAVSRNTLSIIRLPFRYAPQPMHGAAAPRVRMPPSIRRAGRGAPGSP
ncbi:MAG: hypothetical protein HY784_15245, partial [Chloroflexi bacterium]|nr:hypothetical protein [Chloroflexota bacterium]